MKLHCTGTSILAGRTVVATIDPTRAEAVLRAEGRHPLIARVLAWGGYRAALQIGRGDAERAGRDLGLLK